MQDLNDKVTGNSLPAAEWNQQPSEIQNIIEAAGITLSGADLNQLGKTLSFYIANGDFYTDSGAADAYVLTVQAPKQASPDYGSGEKIVFFPTNNSTGASTVNRDGIGVVDLKDENGNALANGALQVGSLIEFRFNLSANEFRLVPTLSATIQSNLKSGRKNLVVNGDFLVNQRGLSFTPTATEVTSDQWQYNVVEDGGSLSGSSVDITAFTLGQTDVDNNPRNFLNFAGSVATGGGSEILQMTNRVPDVRNLGGQVATYSVWLRGSIGGDVVLHSAQNFGSGGGASADVTVLAEDITLTTSFQRFDFTVTLPSIAGKTIGTSLTDHISFNIVKQAGATIAASLGITAVDFAGTIDISDGQIEDGNFVTDFDRLSEEDALDDAFYFLQRFTFDDSVVIGNFTWNAGASDIMECILPLSKAMRVIPSGTVITATGNMINKGNGSISIALGLFAVTAPLANLAVISSSGRTEEGIGDSAIMVKQAGAAFVIEFSAEITS